MSPHTTRSIQLVAIAPILSGLLVAPSRPAGACASNFPEVTGAAQISTIRLRGVSAGVEVCQSCVTNAGNAWNTACSGDQNPAFQSDGADADLTVDVEFRSGNNNGSEPGCSTFKCGCTKLGITGGRISSARVIVWETANGGQANCGAAYEGILKHELGHVQGLKEAPACSNRIMGNATGSVTIRAQECERIDGNFLTLDEQVPTDDGHPCKNPQV